MIEWPPRYVYMSIHYCRDIVVGDGHPSRNSLRRLPGAYCAVHAARSAAALVFVFRGGALAEMSGERPLGLPGVAPVSNGRN